MNSTWESIIDSAEFAVGRIKEEWRKKQKFPRMIISWPIESVETDDGAMVDLVTMHVPDNIPTYKAAVDITDRTKPYALLVIDRTEKELKVILESFHGTRCWTFSIERHGDMLVLDKETATANRECLGLLWRKSKGIG